MHRGEVNLNDNLAQALNWLGINENRLRDDKGTETEVVSPREHAKALFTYLNMAGYLSESILGKAVDYLAAAKPFAYDKRKVLSDLNNACQLSNRNGQFDAEFFISNFGKQKYFTVNDIIDLLVFLQQTAFDRQHGVERDRLQAKPWMEEHKIEFIKMVTKLGIVTPLPPQREQYAAAGIMGAASARAKSRLEYFRDLKIDCNLALAFSGYRELSKGLDEEKVMDEIAGYLGKPVNYVKKPIGVDTREFLDGITETMMVNYFIETICPNMKIGIVDSAIERGHWRATSKQNAADVAPLIIDKILSREIENTEEGRYHFLIIAEQPYAGRMAKQVQREFDKEIKRRGLEDKIRIEVEGCGPGISEQELVNTSVLTRLNSELGALMAERFNGARPILQQKPELALRDPSILMFNQRDEKYKTYQAPLEYDDELSRTMRSSVIL